MPCPRAPAKRVQLGALGRGQHARVLRDIANARGHPELRMRRPDRRGGRARPAALPVCAPRRRGPCHGARRPRRRRGGRRGRRPERLRHRRGGGRRRGPPASAAAPRDGRHHQRTEDQGEDARHIRERSPTDRAHDSARPTHSAARRDRPGSRLHAPNTLGSPTRPTGPTTPRARHTRQPDATDRAQRSARDAPAAHPSPTGRRTSGHPRKCGWGSREAPPPIRFTHRRLTTTSQSIVSSLGGVDTPDHRDGPSTRADAFPG